MERQDSEFDPTQLTTEQIARLAEKEFGPLGNTQSNKPNSTDGPDESSRTLAKQAGATVWRDPRTGILYQKQDAAFSRVLRPDVIRSIRSSGGFVIPPKARGIK